MKHRLRFAVHTARAAALCLLATACRAELPPLSPDEQRTQAAVIVTGKVRGVAHRTVAVKESSGFLNDDVTATVLVEQVLKGDGVRGGQTIRVHTWKAKKRPEHWAGPGGQYRPLKAGARVTLFLKQGDHGLELLIPNGWETPGKAPAAPGAQP